MPVYEYRCTDCGEQLEVRQSFTDEALTVCPTCSGRLRKVLSPVGVVFKGSGFYRNDSRASEANGSGADGSAAPDKEPAGKGDKSDKGSTKESGSTPKEAAAAPAGSGSGSGSGGSNGSSGRTSSGPPSTVKAATT